MSGSIANLDIKIDVKSIKEALPLLEKLASVAAKVEKQTDSIAKTATKAAQSPNSIDKQADKQAKALAALERNLERGARRYEEIQRAMNRAGIGDRLRVDLQNRMNRALTEYNKVVSNSGSTMRQVAGAVRQYENTVKGLNESLKTTATIEKQRSRALQDYQKFVRAEADAENRRRDRNLQDRQRYARQEADYENKQREKLSADKQRYIRSEADYENRQREKMAGERQRYTRQEAEYENKQRDRLSADKQRYMRADADFENRQRERLAADRHRYMRTEADAENRQREKLSADKQRYIRADADYENRQRERLAADKYRLMRAEADAENKQRDRQASDKRRYIQAEAEAENKYRDTVLQKFIAALKKEAELEKKEREKAAADKRKYMIADAEEENRRRDRLSADRQRFVRAEADAENRSRDKLASAKYRYMRAEADEENRQREKAAAERKKEADRRVNDAIQSERRLQSALETARSRVSSINLRADRQLSPIDARTIQGSAYSAFQQLEAVLRTSGAGTREAIEATGRFQRTMQGLSSEIARTNGLLPALDKNARTISASFGAANASLGGFSRLIFSTNAALASMAGALGLREIVQAAMEFDRFSNTLKTVSGSTAEYTRNLNFLLAEGDRVGFNVGEVSNSFARLSVAMKGANFTGEQSREAFTNLTEAARNFGLSSADTMGIIRALEQSLSKGKFMAEEVRLQMGDRLPIAMAALNAALAKVDGKLSNVSDRFEKGTIDVQRYALEFTRQINSMSGGAAALERTSNTIAAAFGRLGNELQRSLMVFKEEGFDAAVINTTNALTKLMALLRQSEVITKFAQALEYLSKNLDYLLVAIIALSTSWLARLLVGFVMMITRINLITAAVSGLVAGIVGLGVGFYDSTVAIEKSAARFKSSAEDMDASLIKIKSRSEEVNSSMQRGFQLTASSAQTEFEKLIAMYEKAGFAASEAIKQAFKAQAEVAKIEIDKMRNEYNNAAAEITKTYQALQGSMRGKIQFQAQDSYGGQEAQNFARDLLTILDTAAKIQTPLGDVIAQIERLKVSSLESAKGNEAALLKINVMSDDLIAKFKDPKSLASLAPLLEQFVQLNARLDEALARYGELVRLSSAAAQGTLPAAQMAGEFGVVDGQASATMNYRFDYSRFNPKGEQLAKANAFLQEALRGTQMNGDKGQNLIIRDQKQAEAYLNQLRFAAKGTGAAAESARAILKKYNEELEKGDKKTSDRKKTLADYNMELNGHLAQNYKIIEAYKQSAEAGALYEDTVEAIREVGKYIKPTYDEAGNATGKFAAAIKDTIDRKRELEQTERDIKAFKDSQFKAIENELELIQKEKGLLNENVQLRKEEVEVLKRRQELTKDGPVDEEILKRAELQTRALVKQRRELKYLEDSYAEFGKMFETAFDRVADSIVDAFARGEISAIKFGDIARAVAASIISSFLKLSIINPVLNSIFPQDSIRPTIFGALGMGGAGGAGAGGIMDYLGLTSLIPKDGILSSLGISGGAGGILSTQLWGNAAIEPSLAMPGGMMPSGATLGGVLGAAGAGFGVGSLLGGLIAGNNPNRRTNSMIGAGLGTAAGLGVAALASLAIPGLGTLAAVLGGALGGGLGGLIGPKPANQGWGFALRANGGNDGWATGNALTMTDQFFNEQGREYFQQAEVLVGEMNKYMAENKLTVYGARAIGGSRHGMGGLGYGEAESLGEVLASLTFGSSDNAGLDRYLKTQTFDDPAKLQEAVTGFKQAEEALKALTDEPVPAFTASMDAMKKTFDDALTTVQKYGLEEAGLTAARIKAIAALEDQRTETLRQISKSMEYRRLVAQGMTQEAELLKQEEDARLELKAFEDQLKSLALTAEEVGARLVELEEIHALERAAIITRNAEQANNELERAIESIMQAGGGIRQFIDDLMATEQGNQSIPDRYAASQAQFARDIALARINDPDALQRITQTAGTLLENGRDMFASSAEYWALQDSVIAQLEDLPATKSYDQRIADGIEVSNGLLTDQLNILTMLLSDSTNYVLILEVRKVNASILALANLNLAVGNLTNENLVAMQTLMLAIGNDTIQTVYGTTKALYEIGVVTHDLLYGLLMATFDTSSVTHQLQFATTEAIVLSVGATNKLIYDHAVWMGQIATVTHELLVAVATGIYETASTLNLSLFAINRDMLTALNATNLILVDGFNATNTILVGALGTIATNYVNGVNATNTILVSTMAATNTNLVNGFVAVGAFLLALHGLIDTQMNKMHNTTLKDFRTDMNTHLYAMGVMLFSISESAIWIKENAFRTANNTARMVDAFNFLNKTPWGVPGQLGIYATTTPQAPLSTNITSPNTTAPTRDTSASNTMLLNSMLAANMGLTYPNPLPATSMGIEQYLSYNPALSDFLIDTPQTFNPSVVAAPSLASMPNIASFFQPESANANSSSSTANGDTVSSDEFYQYRLQSAAETRTLKESLDGLKDEVKELNSVMSRSTRRD